MIIINSRTTTIHPPRHHADLPSGNEITPNMTIVYLENIEAFENFMTSPEIATFEKTKRGLFPLGLKYTWHVQYQLVNSLRN